MIKLIRRLKISLATKCQLLFGAAVVLVILSALLVPWQRMEQLSEQTNESAARMLAEQAVQQHVSLYTVATTRPWLSQAAELPAAFVDPKAALRPRLIGINGPYPQGMTRFEATSLNRFRADPERAMRSSLDVATNRYRYAEPLMVRSNCLSCHANDGSASAVTVPVRPLAQLDPTTVRDAGLRSAAGEADAPDSAAAIADEIEPTVHRPVSQSDATQSDAIQPAATRPSDRQPAANEPGSTQPATTQPTGPLVGLGVRPRLLGMVSVDIPSQTSGQQQLLNRVLMLLAGLIAGALAGVTMYLIITRIILQPVRVLQETAEKVSSGDLNIRSHINSGDEFQQLSETFNGMLANLKTSSDQLQEMNKSLDSRLGQLAEANVALFEANKLKSEFIASVSHELRTPLNSILGFADLLKDALPSDAKQLRYLTNIINSGNNLLDLINDLLDLAKIEAGRMDVRVQPLSLSDLFEGLATLLKPLCAPRRLTIAIDVRPGVPILHTDGARLQQILYNFLSNAIKFSPDDGVINLSAAPVSGGRVRIEVADAGPGIPPDMLEVIFEKFRQADQSHTRQHGGTGLGLAIARELTVLLGGTIGVESVAGHGATFWCALPVKIDSADAANGAMPSTSSTRKKSS